MATNERPSGPINVEAFSILFRGLEPSMHNTPMPPASLLAWYLTLKLFQETVSSALGLEAAAMEI